MKVLEVAYHRNGVSGQPFYACRFTDDGREYLGIVPDTDRRWPDVECYVIATDRIATDGVEFGVNSWRGDTYAKTLYAAIDAKFPPETEEEVSHV